MLRLSFAVVATLLPAWALACETDPFLFQLPGETVEQAHERSENIRSDFRAVGSYNRQERAFHSASSIYLARVIAAPQSKLHLPVTRTVRPVQALKGQAPETDRVLSGWGEGGLCSDLGDGRGAFAKLGDLVVVFEGLPTSAERPRGIDSMPAMAIRIVELLDRLRAFGKDIESELADDVSE